MDFVAEYNATGEVANQLQVIRKEHDKLKDSNLRKQKELERLRQEVDALNRCDTSLDRGSKSEESRKLKLQATLDALRNEHEEELQSKKSYLHMLERMKKDKLSMEQKTNGLQRALKSAQHLVHTETDRFRKARELKYRSHFMLKEVAKGMRQEERQKEELMLKIEKTIRQHQELNFKRHDRLRRQAAAAEAAANEDRDSHEAKLRTSLNLHKLWYNFLNRKLELEKLEAGKIEQAFQRIRSYIGITDINEIVEKFLTREQTYSSLLALVTETETKLEEVKTRNAETRKGLHRSFLQEGDREVVTHVHDLEAALH